LSVSRVSFLIFVRDYLRRSRPRVQIAKAAITGEYVTQMVARLECGVLAVPVHGALSDVNHRAPRGITISSAGRSPKRHRGGERSNAKCQFRNGFCHDLNTAREKHIPFQRVGLAFLMGGTPLPIQLPPLSSSRAKQPD
jgi:hypothetical protein